MPDLPRSRVCFAATWGLSCIRPTNGGGRLGRAGCAGMTRGEAWRAPCGGKLERLWAPSRNHEAGRVRPTDVRGACGRKHDGPGRPRRRPCAGGSRPAGGARARGRAAGSRSGSGDRAPRGGGGPAATAGLHPTGRSRPRAGRRVRGARAGTSTRWWRSGGGRDCPTARSGTAWRTCAGWRGRSASRQYRSKTPQ